MPITSPELANTALPNTALPNTALPKTADAVVVGGGTVGAWCACFLREAGLSSVVLLEKGVLGQGSSSRAAGVVRVQGGTPEAVRLGRWSREFYLGQRDWLGTDSGFVQQGYLLPACTPGEVTAAHARIEMQRSLGLPVRWLTPDEVSAVNPTLAAGTTLGASYCAEDGYITPPRNVAAYTAALVSQSVVVAERTRFTGLLPQSGGASTVTTSRGNVSAGLVVLAGGSQLAAVGAAAGIAIPAGGVRHHVAVTEEHPAFADTPMVFDVPAGIYWRPEEGGLLFGMSDPDEPAGENRLISFEFLALMRSRLGRLVPLTERLGVRRVWAATIDFTPDHLPIIGPAPGYDSVFVASAGGAGMMWGPAVARAVSDLSTSGSTSVVDVTDLGLDRFDATGHSRVAADPIALPFPEKIGVPGKTVLPGEEDLIMPADSNAPVIDTALLAAAATAALEDWGPLEEAASDAIPMHVRGRTLWAARDESGAEAGDESGAEAGIWECTAGPSYWVQEENEVIYVLSGTLTVTPDGGQAKTLGPGDVAVFPRGWRGAWDLHETVRKVYVVF